MSSNGIDDVDRGLVDAARRPVMPNETRHIDRWIEQTRAEIEATLLKIQKAPMTKYGEPPQGLMTELERKVDKLYQLTMHRIRKQTRLGTDELGSGSDDFARAVKQAEDIDRMPFLADEWKSERADHIRLEVANRLSEKLEWVLEKLRRGYNHPVWQKDALDLIALQRRLGIGKLETRDDEGRAIDAEQFVYRKIEEYQIEKEKQIKEWQETAELEAQDYSKSYRRIQQKPGDPLFVKRKARGTHDRGI